MMTVRQLCVLLRASTLPQKAGREEWGEESEALAKLYDILWQCCHWVSVKEVDPTTDKQAVLEVMETQVAALASQGVCKADCQAARDGLRLLRQRLAKQEPAPP